MERIIDKTIILICCVAMLFFTPFSTPVIVGLLVAVAVSALRETAFPPEIIRNACILAYLVVALTVPEFVLFVPLMAYDCVRMRPIFLRICWVLPFFFVTAAYSLFHLAFVVLLAMIASLLSWRTNRLEKERADYRSLRDELRELSLALEIKNRDLREKQDYEVNLATLSERGRIAREIHDNVGHLLTRSVLQIEALQVVHADDPKIKTELEQVGATIHEAFDTVRESVHDLHEDSFDLYLQLQSLVERSKPLVVDLDYQGEETPQALGYCFLAIAREALANTLKHSDAKTVKISVLEYPAFWQLVIQDDGSINPFRPGEKSFNDMRPERVGGDSFALTNRTSGIGLQTMEERTRSLGGIFRIDYEKGFRVFVSVPKKQIDEKGRQKNE